MRTTAPILPNILLVLSTITDAQATECPVTVPICGERSTLCPHKRCTRPDGKCNKTGDGCLDIRWNRDYCVDAPNKCGNGFCGTTPDFADCYCENDTCIVRGKENENSTESVPASAPSMMDEVETNTRPTVGWCEADGCDQLSV
ncbi:hypothetical protein ACHAXN_010210 [Cyclotella atomus]